MKRTIFLNTVLLVTLLAFTSQAQDKKIPSPAATTEATFDGIKVKIDYSQPSARGRKIMGGLVPFGEVWRTGANASTSIEFSADAKVEGKAIVKGKYALFTIPGEDEWTIIINKTIKVGAYSYKESEDLLRVKVKPSRTGSFVETFNISTSGNQVILKWENTQVAFAITK